MNNGQPAPVLWLLGQSAAGKTTVAKSVAQWLRGGGQPVGQLAE